MTDFTRQHRDIVMISIINCQLETTSLDRNLKKMSLSFKNNLRLKVFGYPVRMWCRIQSIPLQQRQKGRLEQTSVWGIVQEGCPLPAEPHVVGSRNPTWCRRGAERKSWYVNPVCCTTAVGQVHCHPPLFCNPHLNRVLNVSLKLPICSSAAYNSLNLWLQEYCQLQALTTQMSSAIPTSIRAFVYIIARALPLPEMTAVTELQRGWEEMHTVHYCNSW